MLFLWSYAWPIEVRAPKQLETSRFELLTLLATRSKGGLIVMTSYLTLVFSETLSPMDSSMKSHVQSQALKNKTESNLTLT